MYIYQYRDWPNLKWKSAELINDVSEVRLYQGKILGKLMNLGFEMKDEATIEALSLEIVKSNAIEGERLNREDVRSSIARHMGKEWSGSINRNIDGHVEVMMDATKNAEDPITNERLHSWHAAIFPTGYSGMNKIKVGGYRNKPDGSMVVESANYNRPIVHFEAPKDEMVFKEMQKFIEWFNTDQTEPILKSGVAHLWFLTVHPYEDGNGRIARALSDLQLMRSDTSDFRFYSISDQIETNRKWYYKNLEKAQKGTLDITRWLKWYLSQVKFSLLKSHDLLKSIIIKSEFWIANKEQSFNERQHKIINKMFDGFEGVLNTSKWAKINKCSEDTALRDIQNLVNKKILVKGVSGGRSSYYYLKAQGDLFHQKKSASSNQGMSM